MYVGIGKDQGSIKYRFIISETEHSLHLLIANKLPNSKNNIRHYLHIHNTSNFIIQKLDATSSLPLLSTRLNLLFLFDKVI